MGIGVRMMGIRLDGLDGSLVDRIDELEILNIVGCLKPGLVVV